MERSLGVVIPAYEPNVNLLVSYVRTLDEQLAPTTIRIELDDPTPELSSRLTDVPATVNSVSHRRGKGAAITDGFEAIDTDVLAFADADGSVPAASVQDVVVQITSGDADLAVGSRRHPDATIRSHQTYARRWLGHGFAFIARVLLEPDLYDYQCGAKAISRSTWQAVRAHLYEPGFAWDVELVAVTAALGYRIMEIPVVWEDHPESTVSTLGTTIALGQGLLAARHRAARLREGRNQPEVETGRVGEPALVNRRSNDD